MARIKRSLDERIRKLELELAELKEAYATQLYFETMPEYDPVYTYCYSTSNRYIPYEFQSLDAWLRAVKQHMATRSRGHGGESSTGVIISVPTNLTKKGIEDWVNYTSQKLRKVALQYTKRSIIRQ